MQITYTVPFAVTAELTADSGGGQGIFEGCLTFFPGFFSWVLIIILTHCMAWVLCIWTGLAIGVLNLAIVVPQVLFRQITNS